jgi:hypothetical protein
LFEYIWCGAHRRMLREPTSGQLANKIGSARASSAHDSK